jgi:hypothetical protein
LGKRGAVVTDKTVTTEAKTTLAEELNRATVKVLLPKAKEQAIALGDIEWLERLHEIERKHAG